MHETQNVAEVIVLYYVVILFVVRDRKSATFLRFILGTMHVHNFTQGNLKCLAAQHLLLHVLESHGRCTKGLCYSAHFFSSLLQPPPPCLAQSCPGVVA